MYSKNLVYQHLNGKDLRGKDMSYASFYRADFTGAKWDETTNFFGADFRESIGTPFIPMVCPSQGPFIGWKVALKEKGNRMERCIVRLWIPSEAKRASGTIRFCRCDRARVISIEGATEAWSINDPDLKYEVGEMVYADSFDEDRWENYGHGIYFFIDREEAVRYMEEWG